MNRIFRQIFALTVLVFLLLPAHGQEKNTVSQGQYWLNYSLNKKISSKISLRVSAEDRRYFVNNRNHMFYVLGDATYKLKNNLSIAAGFMYFNLHRPSDPHSDIAVTQPEFRPYQRLAYSVKMGNRSSLSYGLTVEERIRMKIVNNERQDYYYTYFRFRNKVTFKYRLNSIESNHPLSAYIYDDFMVHMGNGVKGDPFDQNRLGAGLEWGASKNISLKAGYLNWYQQIAGSNTDYKRNIITFAVAQQL